MGLIGGEGIPLILLPAQNRMYAGTFVHKTTPRIRRNSNPQPLYHSINANAHASKHTYVVFSVFYGERRSNGTIPLQSNESK